MVVQQVNFWWVLSEGGYQWVHPDSARASREQPKKVDEAFLTELSQSAVARHYQPLKEYTGLFLEFAETEPSEEGVLAFASRYGDLGSDSLHTLYFDQQNLTGPSPVRSGTPLTFWERSIAELRQATRLWKSCRLEEADALSPLIDWVSGNGEEIKFAWDPVRDPERRFQGVAPASNGMLISNEETRPEFLRRFQPSNPIQPTLAYVQMQINEHLKATMTSKLVWDPDFSKLMLVQAPKDLLTALWFQFANAVDNDSHFRDCIVCKRPFEVAPSKTRKDRKFCSDACRVRMYRENKKREEVKK